MIKYFKFYILLTAFCLLAACTLYKQTDKKIDQTINQIKAAHDSLDTEQPAVITKSGFYVDNKAIPLNHNPEWMNRHINLHAQSMPLNILLHRLLRYYPIAINYDSSVQPHRLVNLNYSGTVKGALDTLASTTNMSYRSNAHVINWSAFETKTFDISFMPGTSNYLVGQNQGQGSTSSSSSSSPLNQINDQQYSNLHAQLSVWNDLKETINELKSKQGHVVISESTTTVTVHDRPNNVKSIARYIKQINLRLSQQVAIKVQVLEVQLNKDFNYGIDWNLLTSGLGTKFRITGNAGSSTNLVNDSLIANSSNSALSRIGIGSNGMDVFINALSQQGKVRIVTEPEVVTLNNQIASIRITQSIGYIESVSQTNTQYFSTSSINPGSITDGFTLYILPKIQQQQVFLQLSSTIASLERLEKVNNIPNSNASTSSSQYQAIQVPTLAQKSFNQRSLVTSGSTLVIAGYKRLRDTNSDASFFGIKPLGGKGASSSNIETLVLITPTILHSSQTNVNINTQ